jgi:hypothetical protein
MSKIEIHVLLFTFLIIIYALIYAYNIFIDFINCFAGKVLLIFVGPRNWLPSYVLMF